MSLEQIPQMLSTLSTSVYHFTAPEDAVAPYLVWGEKGEHVFFADNDHGETAIRGTIDLYTQNDSDPLRTSVSVALHDAGCVWQKSNTQYEKETGLIHDEWTFEVI